MSRDELEATNAAVGEVLSYSNPADERKAALNLAGRAIDRGLVDDLPQVLELLGIIPTDTSQRVFEACGCPQTPENTTPGDRPGSIRCRHHKNRGRAARTYPRNKAGRE